jgi:hypothetical protein
MDVPISCQEVNVAGLITLDINPVGKRITLFTKIIKPAIIINGISDANASLIDLK